MTIKTHDLPNGFRIATEYMPNFKTASLGIWIKAGGRNEVVKQNGVAHFLEHMAFKGTKKRNSFEIAEAIENVGGFINAYTSREITNYYCRILSDDVYLALDVISDIVINSVLEQEEIDIERNVILQEIGQTNDTPDEIIFDWLHETAYPRQPFGRPILGSISNVSSFDRTDLKKFVEKYYTPDRMILCACGNVDHDQIVQVAEKNFGDLKKRHQSKLAPAVFSNGEKRVEKSLEQAHFAMCFETPSLMCKDIYASQIFSVLIGGGMSSRLFQEIREKRGLCYAVGSSLDAVQDTGNMTIYAGTSGDKISELSKVVIDELRRSVSSITDKELERSRSQIKASMLMSLESSASRCARLARTISVWERIVYLEETIEKINSVTLSDLKFFAENLCAAPKLALALYGPVSKTPSVDQLTTRLSS